MGRSESDHNPLLSDSPGAWDDLIEQIGPASLLVVIEGRMGGALRRRHAPEDVYQEAILHAWRDRGRCEWRGVRAFRNWVLTIIDNRIRDLADREGAQKRGGSNGEVLASEIAWGNGVGVGFPVGMNTTSPSRVAVYREQALAMRDALEGLSEDVREVVRLRLFEQRTTGEIAVALGIGESAVRHRFRRGAEEYHRRLIATLAGSSTRGRLDREEGTTDSEPDSSPPVR